MGTSILVIVSLEFKFTKFCSIGKIRPSTVRPSPTLFKDHPLLNHLHMAHQILMMKDHKLTIFILAISKKNF